MNSVPIDGDRMQAMIDIHLSKDNVTGADYRLAAIHLLALLTIVEFCMLIMRKEPHNLF